LGGTLHPRLKRQGQEADHLPPSSAESKNAWNYTSFHVINTDNYTSIPVGLLNELVLIETFVVTLDKTTFRLFFFNPHSILTERIYKFLSGTCGKSVTTRSPADKSK
jgi:hypothetical protein